MKKLKINLVIAKIFLSLLVLSCLWSCQEKEELSPDLSITETNLIQEKVKGQYLFDLPTEFNNKSEKEREEYLLSLSADEMESLHETTRITSFLKENSLYERVKTSIPKGEELAEIDPSSYLDKAQLRDLSEYELTLAESSTCRARYWFDWYGWCGSDHRYYRCGNIYECINGTYVLHQEDHCRSSDTYCSNAESCTGDDGDQYTDDIFEICAPVTPGEAFDTPTIQEMARFASQDMGDKGLKLMKLYISNKQEIDAAFTSSGPQQEKLRKSVQDFLLVNNHLIKNGFKETSTAAIGKQHIDATNHLLETLSTIITNEELRTELGKVRQEVSNLQGKQLRNALTKFGE